MNELRSEKVNRIIDVHKPLSYVIPCTYYGEKIRGAIHKYKFGNCYAYKDGFVHIAEEKLKRYDIFKSFDAVIVLPISRQRMNERGYNQSDFIGEVISRLFNVPIKNEWLRKNKNVRKQSTLNYYGRALNIQDIYSASDEVKDKDIIIADDIYTSGVTLSEAAKTLKGAGANVIIGVTFASAKHKKSKSSVKAM